LGSGIVSGIMASLYWKEYKENKNVEQWEITVISINVVQHT
jgi:hypothetical protein